MRFGMHDEEIGGRWLSKRTVTHVKDERVAFGAGRFSGRLEVINTLIDLIASTFPVAFLA